MILATTSSDVPSCSCEKEQRYEKNNYLNYGSVRVSSSRTPATDAVKEGSPHHPPTREYRKIIPPVFRAPIERGCSSGRSQSTRTPWWGGSTLGLTMRARFDYGNLFRTPAILGVGVASESHRSSIGVVSESESYRIESCRSRIGSSHIRVKRKKSRSGMHKL